MTRKERKRESKNGKRKRRAEGQGAIRWERIEKGKGVDGRRGLQKGRGGKEGSEG